MRAFFSILISILFIFSISCGKSKEEMKKEIKEEVKKELKEEIMEGAKQKMNEVTTLGRYVITMKDMKTAWGALMDYTFDNFEAPQGNVTDFKTKLEPFYIKNFPTKDAWGNEFYYKVDPKSKEDLWLASAGSDGIFKGFDQTGEYTSLDGNDIIIYIKSDKVFVYHPAIKGEK